MFKNPYLIQRLEKPENTTPFDFGGGFVKGGFNDEAYDMLTKLMSFDYMGSAEFEFGAVPDAFAKFVEIRNDLIVHSFKIAKHGHEKKEIHVICHRDILKEVVEWITTDGIGETRMNLKHGTRLYNALGYGSFGRTDVCGWIELQNPFMFFTNKKMFENVKSLFEL